MTATDLTILVVDDDEFQCDLMVIQLANAHVLPILAVLRKP